MIYPFNEIAENIPGIWASKEYELLLGLNNVFTLEEKKSGEIIDGFFSIIQPANNPLPILRLTELNGTNHDYIIHELFVFEKLIISNRGKKIHFKNVPPDEYDGEIINPANN